MRMVQSSVNIVEYVNVNRFQEQVGGWLMRNEVENCHVLATLSELISSSHKLDAPKFRLFALEEQDRFAVGAMQEAVENVGGRVAALHLKNRADELSW